MATLAQRNLKTGMMAALIAVGMVALGFAAVPLYRLFCQVTGFGGTTQRAEGIQAPGAVAGKTIDVRFDGNVAPGFGWAFRPELKVMRVTLGARNIAFYEAINETDRTITGTASFNVTPNQSGQYFSKIQCFCFTEQTLKPGERVRMPVIFYVDPKMIDDNDAKSISEITLSYTFYPSAPAAGSTGGSAG
jgi:cytochrome c oxidase assembly protein subunit 11